MASVRDARRALARGDLDEALVDLWNALEPLRLRGDASGLRDVAGMAGEIARTGDGSQAREAERLLEAVRDTLDPDAGRAFVSPAAPTAPQPEVVAVETEPWHSSDDLEPGEDLPAEIEIEDGDEGRPRLGGLVWALIVAAFILFNVISGLLRE